MLTLTLPRAGVLGHMLISLNLSHAATARCRRDHLELSEALCEEMMTRALECWDSTIQHPVLICLAPWMENLVISAHWKVGGWAAASPSGSSCLAVDW